MISGFSCCDAHLTKYLRRMVPKDKRLAVRVEHISTPSKLYACEQGCDKPATWFILKGAK